MQINPQITASVIELLKQLIETPSYSRDEGAAADLMRSFLIKHKVSFCTNKNNTWATHGLFDGSKPVVLLNSHIDTVKPTKNWDSDPLRAILDNGKLTGLGSNDAGGPLVALLAAFMYLKETEQPYDLIFAATAEEEVSGSEGIASILDELGKVDLAIVGEPTQMQMAIAEKGLMVLDGEVKGLAGHAARNEGINAIYEALPVIEWFKNHQFPKVSDILGPVKMSLTQIEAGTQHNVVPSVCKFVVDVRVNECYSNKELFELIQKKNLCEIKARSFRLNSSSISKEHPLVKRGIELGLSTFGSPTMSDQALMPFTSVKIGPGDSARSHTANEYIYLDEIKQGIEIYIKLLNGLEL